MKITTILFVASLISVTAKAQNPMKIFSGWYGHWQGEGWMQTGPEKKSSTVDEFIESKLDGTIVTMEGIGTAVDQQTGKEVKVHHAFAVLSFHQTTNEYKLRSYLVDGRSTEAWFNVLNDKNFQWGFEAANRKIRYTITLDTDKGTWSEIGEIEMSGAWTKFFEMNLKKVK